jgi:hypothetical protein
MELVNRRVAGLVDLEHQGGWRALIRAGGVDFPTNDAVACFLQENGWDTRDVPPPAPPGWGCPSMRSWRHDAPPGGRRNRTSLTQDRGQGKPHLPS